MWVGRGGPGRRAGTASHVALALVCYVPLLLTARGRVAADTRQAIYLDPGRFVHDAFWMWDPTRDLGTVTHQNIVLVWPMGVYHWLFDALGAPVWLAQRLWMASILFAAGAGVLFLARTIGWRAAGDRGLGPAVAAFAYALSPYALQYGTRTSALLLPWAALPWLIGLTARALSTRGWRHPALVALLVMSVAVNATALALALLGPAVWLLWAVWGTREVEITAALAACGRMAIVGVATSLWWVVGLLIEGRFGLPLLDFTETIDQVASTSSATEVLRGLGYWIPYLQQHSYPEVSGATFYLANLAVLGLQVLVVGATLAGATLLRWRHRAFFVLLVVIGTIVAVGAYPPSDPAPLAAVFHDHARTGGLGLVLRSTTRAAPLALLGMACLLGALAEAAARRARAGVLVGAVAVLLAVALAPSTGRRLVDPLYERPEELPAAWTDAIAEVDANAGGGRMLEIPGIRFAAYRWGTTYEPITAGLAATPTGWREQIPYGGDGTAEVLVSLDNRLQEGRLDPAALAPIARLLGVTQLVVRNDLAYERYDTVAPDRVWDLVDGAPGLGPAKGFGPIATNEPDPAHERSDQPRPADPDATYPAIAVVPVTEAAGLVSVAPLSSTVVLDGSGDGLIDAASAGLLTGHEPVVYAGSVADDGALARRLLDHGARIVLTDTNRRRVERWRSIRSSRGITLRADEDPADSAGSNGGEAALGALPDEPSWQTIAEPQTIWASASRYGNPLWFEAGVRPAAAIDGDLTTAWKVGPTVGGIGDHLVVELGQPVTTDHITIHAADEATKLAGVSVQLDDDDRIQLALDATSRSSSGQRIDFPERTLERISIEVTSIAPSPPGSPDTPVGITEVVVPGPDGEPLVTDEVVRLPTALTDRLGPDSIELPLDVVLTRLDGDARDPALYGEEKAIVRRFDLPTDRTFAVRGSARSTDAPVDGGCRRDLVSLDGVPIEVEVLPPVAGERDVEIRGCGPLVVEAGTHLLRTIADAPIELDQLVFSSPGARAAAATGREIGLSPVDWHQPSHDIVTAEVPALAEDSWLILGQSENEGWSLEGSSLDGSSSDPAAVMVNGFANGFVLDATDRPSSATLRWSPQRSMWIALGVALAGLLAAVVLAVRGRPWQPADAAAAPALDAPWLPGRRLAPGRTLATAGLAGAVAALAVGVPWGVLAALVVGASARSPRGHLLLSTGGALTVGAALGAVVLERAARSDLSPFDFFSTLETPHRLALFGLVLLGADLALPRHEGAPVDPVGASRTAIGGLVAHPRPPKDPSIPERRTLARFIVACAAGLVPAVVLFLGVVTSTSGLLDRHHTSDFYDAQARAILDGRLDLPASTLGIEAFMVDGKAYMYQGPFPALLRLPVAAISDGFDGRLAALSMTLALVLAGAASGWLVWQVRALVRGSPPLGLLEGAGVAIFVFASTGGSVLLFDASQVSVYHESAAWGVALAIAALGAVLRHLVQPARWTLAAATVLATATAWSRASLGLGAIAALGFVALGQAWCLVQRRRGRPGGRVGSALTARTEPTPRALLAAVGAVVLPVVLYCGVNAAKFGTAVAVPWEDQVFASVSAPRQSFLDDNDGSFFGLRFAPTTAVAYLRPDALSVQDRFPWIGFREESIGQRTGYGGVVFDKVDASASVPVAFPLLGALGLAGVSLIALDVLRRGPTAVAIGPLLGGAVGAGTIFVFGFIAHRYLGDVLPALVVAASVGFVLGSGYVLTTTPPRRRTTIACFVVLAVAGAFISLGQTIWYQRVYASPGDEAATHDLYRARADLPRLPVGGTTRVTQGSSLPSTGPAGSLFIVGDCDGVYVSDGSAVDALTRTSWKPVDRTAAVGRYDLDVVLPDVSAGTLEPLLVGGEVSDPHVMALERIDHDHVRIVGRGGGLESTGPVVWAPPSEARHLVIAADPGIGLMSAHLDGHEVFAGLYLPGALPRLGVNDLDDSTAPAFTGSLVERTHDDELCRGLLRSVGSGGDPG